MKKPKQIKPRKNRAVVKTRMMQCPKCPRYRPIFTFSHDGEDGVECDMCRKKKKLERGIVLKSQTISGPLSNYGWADLRRERRMLLTATDVTAVPDFPKGSIEWSEIRRELRELPKAFGKNTEAEDLSGAKKRLEEIRELIATSLN